MTVFRLAVFCWLLGWALAAARNFRHRRALSVDGVLGVHFFLCGIPLLLDTLFGAPEYLQQPELRLSSTDPPTEVLYGLYVAACAPIWWWTARPIRVPRAIPETFRSERFLVRVRTTCVVLAVLPYALVVLSPEQDAYLTYGAAVRGRFSAGGGDWHNLVANTALVGVLATTIALSSYRRVPVATWAIALLSIGASCWIFGKRAIVAIAIVAVGYVLWGHGMIRGRRLYAAVLAGAALLMVYSWFYQSEVRFADDPMLANPAAAGYEGFRIDYFRDDRIKMALHAELDPGATRILEYRGQSLLFDVAFLVPRTVWPGKPWPYSVYFTSATFQILPPRPLGWGMSTSWLDEAIANFGWFGLLLGPLGISAVCRAGDRYAWPPLNVMTLLVAVLLLAVQLPAFLGLFLLWLLLVALARREPTRRADAKPVPTA